MPRLHFDTQVNQTLNSSNLQQGLGIVSTQTTGFAETYSHVSDLQSCTIREPAGKLIEKYSITSESTVRSTTLRFNDFSTSMFMGRATSSKTWLNGKF